jgi:hypothetical protein
MNFNDFTNTSNLKIVKIPIGKLLYILINIGHKNMMKLAKELSN